MRKIMVNSVVLLLTGVLIAMAFIPTVSAGTATRTLPDECINTSSEFTVTITASDYGAIGELAEILCDNWTYVESSLDPAQVEVTANTVMFTLLGDTEFTYTVQAPDEEGACCNITGTLRSQDMSIFSIISDIGVCVCVLSTPTPTATYDGENGGNGGNATVTPAANETANATATATENVTATLTETITATETPTPAATTPEETDTHGMGIALALTGLAAVYIFKRKN